MLMSNTRVGRSIWKGHEVTGVRPRSRLMWGLWDFAFAGANQPGSRDKPGEHRLWPAVRSSLLDYSLGTPRYFGYLSNRGGIVQSGGTNEY